MGSSDDLRCFDDCDQTNEFSKHLNKSDYVIGIQPIKSYFIHQTLIWPQSARAARLSFVSDPTSYVEQHKHDWLVFASTVLPIVLLYV